MAYEMLRWFQRKREAKEEAQRIVQEEFQGLKKLLRKQSVLVEEVHREQQALAAKERQRPEPLIELCDALFHLHRAFRNPGLMSRQHAQVLNMVIIKLDRFSASVGLEMILEEGIPFDPRVHEAVANRNPGAHCLEILEVVQPGYLQNGKVLRPARVIVGVASDLTLTSEGSAPS